MYLSGGILINYSSIKNIKYPEFREYYPVQRTIRPNLMGGAGMTYSFKNLRIGVQYHLYNSMPTTFGNEENEPTNEAELANWIPTTKYTLHTGSNQIQVTFGKRFSL